MRCPCCGWTDQTIADPYKGQRLKPGQVRCSCPACAIPVEKSLVDRRGRCPRCATLKAAAYHAKRVRKYRKVRRGRSAEVILHSMLRSRA
jgi:hypothetical protein